MPVPGTIRVRVTDRARGVVLWDGRLTGHRAGIAGRGDVADVPFATWLRHLGTGILVAVEEPAIAGVPDDHDVTTHPGDPDVVIPRHEEPPAAPAAVTPPPAPATTPKPAQGRGKAARRKGQAVGPGGEPAATPTQEG